MMSLFQQLVNDGFRSEATVSGEAKTLDNFLKGQLCVRVDFRALSQLVKYERLGIVGQVSRGPKA